MSSKIPKPTPTISETHPKGIPPRYQEYADRQKAAVWKNKTSFEPAPRSSGELPVLPPNKSRGEFNLAVDELRVLVGNEHVVLNDKPLDDGWYMEHPNTHDAYAMAAQDDLVSSAIVYPGSTEDVQSIVKWANKHLIPLYPISVGRNLGYGGAAPRVRGSILVDLGHRMNKVLDIDGQNATCLVEPGVTYFKLYEHLKKTGYDLQIDVPDLGGGSVMGNALDRGVGYTSYGDHFGQHSGMEIVLPNGEVYRTGMGALPGNNSWQLFPYGFGPYTDGLFSQSNFGIVTKMGFNLMPKPEGQMDYLVTFPRQEDFGQIIEIIRPLRIKQLINHVPQLRHVISELANTKTRAECYSGSEPIPLDVIQNLAKDLPVGPCSWVFYGCIYGPPETQQLHWKTIKAEFSKVKGAKFFFPKDLPDDHYFRSRENVHAGVPELREMGWINWHPNGAHTFFAPISPITDKDATALLEICQKRHTEFGIDFMPAFCVGHREMHLIDNILYDRNDPVAKAKCHKMLRALIDDAAKLGYGEYRTHLLMQDQVMGTYNWNGNIHRRFNELLKDALDPNGILAPGRSGIWPKAYRGKGWELTKDNTADESSAPKRDSKL